MISFLSLGSNLGNKEENLRKAISMIGERAGQVLATSSFIETQPWGFVSDNAFVNACVKIDTMLTPQQLLRETQGIEKALGRKHKSVDGKYCDRIIDIDILLYGDISVDDDNLKIPHPHMHERDFVMVPLREIM